MLQFKGKDTIKHKFLQEVEFRIEQVAPYQIYGKLRRKKQQHIFLHLPQNHHH
jgi:hypothetical protein